MHGALTSRGALTGALLGGYGTVVAVAGTWIPGFWGDEGASVTMARKSPVDLVETARQVDAVHLTYYFLLQGWGNLFGFSEGGVRALSALAVGLTCVVVAHLGRHLVDAATGLGAALVYPWLPVPFHDAGEARSAALTALVISLYVVACTRVWDRPGSWSRWLVAGAVLVVATWLFLYCLLAAPVVLAGLPRDSWATLRRRGLPVAVGVGVLVSPIVVLALRQRGQIAWIPHFGSDWVLEQLVTEQYFLGLTAWVVVGWLLVVTGAVRVVRLGGTTAVVLAAWALVPTLLLLGFDVLVPQVLYQARYLAFTAPAVAILLGAAVTWARPRVALPVLLGVTLPLAALASWPMVQDRLDVDSKSSWRHAQKVLGEQVHPGDGLITFAPLMTVAENVYADPMVRMPLLNADPDSPWLTAVIYPRMGGPLPRTLAIPADVDRIWYLSERTSRDWRTSDPATDRALLAHSGFAPTWATGPDGYDDLVITLFERTP